MPIQNFPIALPWWQSKVIVGSLVGIVCSILSQFHVLAWVAGLDQADLADKIIALIGAIGGIVAIHARATQKVAPPITGSKP